RFMGYDASKHFPAGGLVNLRFLPAVIAILCLSAAAFAQTLTLRVAGVNRNYILHAPSGLEKPPLVFVIHGFNMTGQQEVSLTRMNQVADREKFIVVYPNALPNGSGQQSWDMAGPNDFAFLLAIIDSVDAAHKIDRKRVYASGFSQGGFLSFQLGCRYADVFAAIAPVSGLLNNSAGCNPKRPVPMIFTFGTNEGFDVNGFLQSGRDWVKLNGCDATPTVLDPYPAGNPNSVVTRSIHGSCKEGAEVVIQSVEGGGHEWPMNTQTKVNNSEEVWAFFKKHSLAAPTALHRREGRTSAGIVRAESSGGRIRLWGMGAESSARVLDTRGREIATDITKGSRFSGQ
ncbi:MAG TPA: PHB depolymerase family esterase, partial [Fibrobacteria bacterium]|nr:PHB depolymerase family esterase [Fibrobacteria bacterium]